MDVEIPVLAGYLNVPTQTGFSLNRISKKKACNRYCLLFKSSRHGIERLEICENKDDKNPKIFTLENCVKITQEPSPANLIQIVKKNGTLQLNTMTDEDLKEWVTALQTVAFCDNSGAHATHGAIEEDNDLYCSSFDGLFMITLIPSEASIRCNIEPKAYMLQMTATELQLKSVDDLNAIIAMWPYRFIRKYGYRDGKFTFEAGRKCTTGEGVFTLDHTNPQEVFRCMSAKMKSMKKLVSGGGGGAGDSLNNIDCVENQFSAAASMEPGSRSPLPPSPSNQHAGEFEINSTQSCISLRGFISSNDSLNNFSSTTTTPTSITTPSLPLPLSLYSSSTTTTTSTSANNNNNNNMNSLNAPVPPSIKHIPNKPPRKLPTPLDKQGQSGGTGNIQMHCDKFKKLMNYEPVAITTTSSSLEHNKNTGSTVILKPASPETLRANCIAISSNANTNNNNNPPDLPLRNESTKQQQQQHVLSQQSLPPLPPLTAERDYECIEHITDAWKTLGVSDIKHCERINAPISSHGGISSADAATAAAVTHELPFVWQRSQSQRQHNDKRYNKANISATATILLNSSNTNNNSCNTGNTTGPKIIDIDIGEISSKNSNNNSCPATANVDTTYDRLDFLSPNNKNSSGYKTIVTVTTPGNRLRCNSPPPPNEYELIASPDTEICRKADDSHLGYGVLRKAAAPAPGPTLPPLPLPPAPLLTMLLKLNNQQQQQQHLISATNSSTNSAAATNTNHSNNNSNTAINPNSGANTTTILNQVNNNNNSLSNNNFNYIASNLCDDAITITTNSRGGVNTTPSATTTSSMSQPVAAAGSVTAITPAATSTLAALIQTTTTSTTKPTIKTTTTTNNNNLNNHHHHHQHPQQQNLHHLHHRGINYTIVSKPKRV